MRTTQTRQEFARAVPNAKLVRAIAQPWIYNASTTMYPTEASSVLTHSLSISYKTQI